MSYKTVPSRLHLLSYDISHTIFVVRRYMDPVSSKRPGLHPPLSQDLYAPKEA